MQRKLVVALGVTGMLIVTFGVSSFVKMFLMDPSVSKLAEQADGIKVDGDLDSPLSESFEYMKENIILENDDYFNFKALTKGTDGEIKNNPKVEEFKQALESVFGVSWQDRELAQLDKLFKEILISPDLTRQEKIQLLWEYAQTRNVDIEYQYILESIGMLSPVELIDPIIASYESGISKERKRVLLSVINQALYVGDVEKYPKEQQDFIAANIIHAQHFLKSSLYSETDPELLSELLSTFTSATGSEEEIAAVAKDFLIEHADAKIPSNQRRDLLFKLTLENRSLQDTFLPQLLTAENREDTAFYDMVNVLVTEFGRSEGDNFSDEGKAAFSNFINGRQVDFVEGDEINHEKERIFMNRLEALSSLQADDISQSPHQVLASYVLDNYVAKQSNPLEISTILTLVSDRGVVDILKEKNSEMIPVLEQALRDPSIARSESKRELIQAGLEVLKEASVLNH